MRVLLLLWLLVGSLFCEAQEHLYPESSHFESKAVFLDYDLYLINAFKKSSERGVILKVITVPSFSPESVTFISRGNNGFELSFWEAETHYWNNYQNKPNPQPVERCKIPLSSELAKALELSWESELAKTKYPKEQLLGLDGTTYHFSVPLKMRGSNGEPMMIAPVAGAKLLPAMAGVAWSPKRNTQVGKLVQLSISLREYCLGGKRKAVEKALNNLGVQI